MTTGRVLIDHRPGAEAIAGWLHEQLSATLTEAEVRFGATTPQPDDVVLVLLTPGWLDHPAAPAVTQAVAARSTLISVLLWGATLPPVDRLPPSLLALTQHPVRRIEPAAYERDTQALIDEVDGLLSASGSGSGDTTVTRPPPPPAAGGPPNEPAPRTPQRRRIRPWIGVGVASVLLGVIAGTVFAQVRRSESTVAPPAPATSPPDDGLPRSAEPLAEDVLAWRRESNGVWNVSTVDVTDGTFGVELTAGDESGAQVVSHDRRTVLYLRNRNDGGIDLHAISADGRQDRILFGDRRPSCPRLRRPAWRTDGLLAIACGPELAGDSDTLNLLTLDGSLVRQLDEGFLGDPTFAADGSRLVYPKTPEGNGADGGALYEVAVDGSTPPTKLTGGKKALDDDPVFAPDDDVVAFSRADGDLHWIVTMDLTGSEPGEVVELTTGEDVDRDPSWSPDGTRLAFRRGEDLYVVDRQGEARVVVDTEENGTKPAWTPR